MGLISWFKQKFNIGGLKIKIVEVEPITQEQGWIKGKVTYTTKEPLLAQTNYKLICESTKGSGQDKKTSTSTVSEMSVILGVVLDEPGSRTEDFTFDYDLRNWFEKKGGVLGAASKVAGFFSEKGDEEFYVEISADIKGTWVSPSDRKPIKVMVAR